VIATIATFAFAIMVPTPAGATDYFVATDGNDSASGTSGAPFRTIRKGISVAMPGDTVRIRSGTYTGWSNQINPTRSGRADAWITFRADDGALPIVEPTSDITGGSGFEPVDVAVSYIRVEGIVARNWPTSGFSNGWNFPSSNIQVRYCIAENNGVNGITFYKASNVLFEYNIAAHNGNRAPSWSSGFNLFTATGSYQTNIVRGNVSFENIDICGDPAGGCDPASSTDGNGFILDQQSTGALFVNNIGFRNGGSCIRLTNSSGAHIINNTCFHDAQDTGYAFEQDEIFFSDNNSRTGAVVRNNVAAGISGVEGMNSAGSATVESNHWVGNNGATAFFTNPTGPNPDFRPTASATELVNVGSATEAPANDIGFDPRCIRQQAGSVSFWQYAPDYTYIASIGGVAACFHPATRPQGAVPDIGAYETGVPAECTMASDCNDDDPCTMDTCGGTGRCNHSPVMGCCKTAADCNDSNACTADTCNTSNNACVHTPGQECCMATADCDDGNACTSDACNLATHECTSNPIPRCCASNADCTSPSACLRAICNTATGACATEPLPGCCMTAADCNDGVACTTDSCGADGNCSNAAIATCCASAADCDDGDPCTVDACDAASGQCSNAPGACGTGGTTGGTAGGPSGGAPGTGGSGDSDGGTAEEAGGCGCRAPGSGVGRRSLAAVSLLLVLSLVAFRKRRVD
jgi:hypothetical protein